MRVDEIVTQPKATNAKIDPDVRQELIPFCKTERRTMNNAVNLLVIEALTARGLWPAEPRTDR